MSRTRGYNCIREQKVGSVNGLMVEIEKKRMELLGFWLA